MASDQATGVLQQAGQDATTRTVDQAVSTASGTSATRTVDQAVSTAAGTAAGIGAGAAVGNIVAVPDSIRQVGQQALTLATDVANIVSSGAALVQAAGTGNMGFLTVPALAALTVAQLAALKNLGSQLDAHGQALGGAARSYAGTEDAIRTAAGTQAAANQPVLQGGSVLLAVVQQDAATAGRQVGTLTAHVQEV